MEKVLNKKRENQDVHSILNELKYDVLKNFELVCPTETSFQRTKKDMHDSFDDAIKKLETSLTK